MRRHEFCWTLRLHRHGVRPSSTSVPALPSPFANSIERMIERIDRPVRLMQDVSLFRPSDVKSIAGDTASLRALGVRPASPDITRALMALLDEAGVPARSTAQRQDH